MKCRFYQKGFFFINKPFDCEASVEILLDLYKWIGQTPTM